jgi:chromosome segregation and condensation protein ScpB
MLAPLENRSLLTVRGCDEECAVEKEMRELRRALRASHLRLRRSALRGTRQVMALKAELAHLRLQCERQGVQIARYANGAVVVDLERKLMALSEANARLVDDSRRAVMLERVLGVTDAELRRISRERDALAEQLVRCLNHPLFNRGEGNAWKAAKHGGDHVERAL